MGSGTTMIISSVKILLMSTGALFIAILLSLSLPQLLGSSASDLIPTLWSSFRSWLRPPYLYFIINGIIITIAASSRLHHSPSFESAPHAPPKLLPHQYQHDVVPYYDAVSVKDVGVVDEEVVAESIMPVEFEIAPLPEVEIGGEAEESTVVESSMWTPPSPLIRHKAVESWPEIFSERLPASSRFAHHRRNPKDGPAEGGKALRRVAKPKKQETLESTWKAITEGRHMPLTRHLKKSDTWETHDRQIDLLDSSPEVKKSETFKDRTNYTPPPVPSSFKLRKEPSLSHDELNRRVEAFINKFNEDIRLQRQQSIQQFMEMINRAA